MYNHTKKYYISARRRRYEHATRIKLGKSTEGNVVKHEGVHTVQLHYIKLNKREKVIHGVRIREGSYPSVGRGERPSGGNVTAEDGVTVPDQRRLLGGLAL